jgi:hypothetical protein
MWTTVTVGGYEHTLISRKRMLDGLGWRPTHHQIWMRQEADH